MKTKLLALLALIVIAVPFLYGQGTITLPGMTEVTSISANDLLWVWLDPAGTNASRKIKASNLLKQYRSCEIVFGDPKSTSPVLEDGDDQPVACGNVSGVDATITAVACYADAGTPSIAPVLSGGSSTSILSSGSPAGTLPCGTAQWASGTVQTTPAPVVHSFSANGSTCALTPCTLDANIYAAGGVAKYVIVRFTLLW